MIYCPNCSYKLVLLSNRRKYKCAKCSRLFLQKSIESKTFRNWNKSQRQITEKQIIQNFEEQWLKYKKQFEKPKISPEERKLRAKESAKKRRLNNIEKCREYSRVHYKKYYQKNKDKIRECYKLWMTQNREEIRARERQRYNKNKDKIRARRRQIRKENKLHYNLTKKALRDKNIELTRLQARIDYWKQQQKLLADSILKNKQYSLSTSKIFHSVPTFLHCELLKI